MYGTDEENLTVKLLMTNWCNRYTRNLGPRVPGDHRQCGDQQFKTGTTDRTNMKSLHRGGSQLVEMPVRCIEPTTRMKIPGHVAPVDLIIKAVVEYDGADSKLKAMYLWELSKRVSDGHGEAKQVAASNDLLCALQSHISHQGICGQLIASGHLIVSSDSIADQLCVAEFAMSVCLELCVHKDLG